jgi:hypothetical protein
VLGKKKTLKGLDYVIGTMSKGELAVVNIPRNYVLLVWIVMLHACWMWIFQ